MPVLTMRQYNPDQAKVADAAPELLEALQKFMDAYDIIDDGPDESDLAMANVLIVEALEKGKIAISKAKGELR